MIGAATIGDNALDNVLDSAQIMNDFNLEERIAESEGAPASWRARCFGRPSLEYDGRPRGLPREPTALVLWVYLLVHRQGEGKITEPVEGIARRLAVDPDMVAEGLASLPPADSAADATSLWLDCAVFEALGRRGLEGERGDPRDLAEAARLYRGDLMEGIDLKHTGPLADWLITERRRLRRLAGEVLRTLIDTYLARGEQRLGTRWARRLVTIDPLGEEGHRYLIRCYGETGRRRQAQEQFEELRRLLAERLGCAPARETRRVLAQALEHDEATDTFAGEPVGPLLPLVGRDGAYHRLEEEWRIAARGCRLSLLSGEPGVGKTRLVRTLLDSLSARGSHRILVARCDGLIRQPYQAFGELLTNGLEDHGDLLQRLGKALDDGARRQVGRLLPKLLGRDAPLTPITEQESRRAFFDALIEALAARARLADEEQGEVPALDNGLPSLVIFVDDLHLADADTWDFFGHLLSRSDLTWWIVATCQPTTAEGVVRHLGVGAGERIGRLELERIPEHAIEEIAAALVEGEQIPLLRDFLARRGLGLPVAMAEWVNYLWDDHALALERDHWRLQRSLAELDLAVDEPIESLTARRIQRLPSSVRRLVALAAVLGQRVDKGHLRRIEEEHHAVIELGLQCLVERWILKPHSVLWSSPESAGAVFDRAASDPSAPGLGRSGEAGGQAIYEFAHRRIRQAVYHSLAPERRRTLHATVARHLVNACGNGEEEGCEELAHHFRAAGAWAEAYPYLRRAARRAVSLFAPDTARHYFDRTLEAIDRCREEARNRGAIDEVERWGQRRRRVIEERDTFVHRAG